MAGGHVEDHRRAHAVADEDRAPDRGLLAQPGDVVGEPGHGVVLHRCVARSVTPQVDGDRPVVRREVIDLRREVGVVARPSVHEHERRVSTPALGVREAGRVALDHSHRRAGHERANVAVTSPSPS